MDIATLVTRAAQRFPDRVAVEGLHSQLTFGQLAARVVRLGNALLASGLRAGDRVLDLQQNSVTYLETDLAIRSAGLVRVALNHRLHAADWERIAADCGARALIYEAGFSEQTESLRAGMEHVVVIGDAPGTPYDNLVRDGSTRRLPAQEAGATCGLHYSSGTTGHPKGAQRTHRNWFASLINMTHDVLGGPPRSDDVYVHAGPITHTSGLFVLPFLIAGARQIVLPAWDPETFVEAVRERGATHTAIVPTMVVRLLAMPSTDREMFAGLRMLGYAGAPMAAEQMRQAYERITPHLVQYYGLVEAIPPVTVLGMHDHRRALAGHPELLASAGRPALGVEVQVVDDTGAPLPSGEVGEVITRGDHVMPGYWNAEHRADLAKSVRDGWLHTGDLGRLSDDGQLWLVDRVGDLIISGGYNIYPREVEDVIAEVPGVAEVAVIGVADREWGQRVVALSTVVDGADVDETAVLDHCRSRMASYKKPKQVRVVDSLPVNSTGKIAKRVLRAQLEAERNA